MDKMASPRSRWRHDPPDQHGKRQTHKTIAICLLETLLRMLEGIYLCLVASGTSFSARSRTSMTTKQRRRKMMMKRFPNAENTLRWVAGMISFFAPITIGNIYTEEDSFNSTALFHGFITRSQNICHQTSTLCLISYRKMGSVESNPLPSDLLTIIILSSLLSFSSQSR